MHSYQSILFLFVRSLHQRKANRDVPIYCFWFNMNEMKANVFSEKVLKRMKPRKLQVKILFNAVLLLQVSLLPLFTLITR